LKCNSSGNFVRNEYATDGAIFHVAAAADDDNVVVVVMDLLCGRPAEEEEAIAAATAAAFKWGGKTRLKMRFLLLCGVATFGRGPGAGSPNAS
jgi:hypothetical protein